MLGVKTEMEFWEKLEKNGDNLDLRYARDIPDDAPQYIISHIEEFERDVAKFCYNGANGLILDAGCGCGNLMVDALSSNPSVFKGCVGLDFSRQMLMRASRRTSGFGFSQGCVDKLPFRDCTFDRVICSGVLTCLPSVNTALDALLEFHRVLKPNGVVIVDYFNSSSHFTRFRKHFMREDIHEPEYISPMHFERLLSKSGFHITAKMGFDFKPFQGYLFMSRLRALDPCFVQERFTRFMERSVVPRHPKLSDLGYRIYVKCEKA